MTVHVSAHRQVSKRCHTYSLFYRLTTHNTRLIDMYYDPYAQASQL